MSDQDQAPRPPRDTRPAHARDPREAEDEQPLDDDADVEEQFNHFWKTYGNYIFIAIASVGIITVGWQTWEYMGDQAAAQTSAEFAAAQSPQERLTFAENNAGKPLGQFALLELANEALASGDMALARDRYAELDRRGVSIDLRQRAALGLAAAQYALGEESDAVATWERVAANEDFLGATRAEALYQLSVYAYAQGNATGAFAYLDRLNAIELPGLWGSAATSLRDEIVDETGIGADETAADAG